MHFLQFIRLNFAKIEYKNWSLEELHSIIEEYRIVNLDEFHDEIAIALKQNQICKLMQNMIFRREKEEDYS